MAGRWIVAALLGVLLALTTVPLAGADEQAEPVELVLFHLESCPHCASERAFLADLQERYPDLVVRAYEVSSDPASRSLFVEMARDHGIEPRGVPTTFLGERVWVGFEDSIAREIEATVAALLAGEEPVEEESSTVDVPFVGEVDVGDKSLLAATLLIGFVDGVNPCSLWVLSLLLALVLHSGSRARVFAVGGMFLAITSLLYGLYMLGIVSVLDYVDQLAWIRAIIAAIAITFGVFHLKEYYAPGRGPSLTISDSRKPGLYRRMRGLADPEKSAPAVLAGTALLAAGVSLVETPCTAGLPVLWSQLVADVSWAGRGLLFLVYLAVFLVDELVVFTLAVVTMRAAKLQEHHGRFLQLLSGTVLVVLGGVIVVAPEMLETLRGTVVVFAGAALAVAALVLLDRLRHHGSGAVRLG